MAADPRPADRLGTPFIMRFWLPLADLWFEGLSGLSPALAAVTFLVGRVDGNLYLGPPCFQVLTRRSPAVCADH